MKRITLVLRIALWIVVAAAALYGLFLSATSCVERLSKHESDWLEATTARIEQRI